jgi:hypothetical protein
MVEANCEPKIPRYSWHDTSTGMRSGHEKIKMKKKKNRRTTSAEDAFLETLGPSRFASEVQLQIHGCERREDEPRNWGNQIQGQERTRVRGFCLDGSKQHR